jgi:tetratricopeptide (TPR) repeat protein
MKTTNAALQASLAPVSYTVFDYTNQANEHLSMGDYEQARLAFARALSLEPANPSHYVEIARCFMEMNEYGRAYTFVKLAFNRINAKQVEQAFDAYSSCAEVAGEIGATNIALWCYNELMKYPHVSGDVYIGAATCLIDRKEYPLAEVYLSKAKKFPGIDEEMCQYLYQSIFQSYIDDGSVRAISLYHKLIKFVKDPDVLAALHSSAGYFYANKGLLCLSEIAFSKGTGENLHLDPTVRKDLYVISNMRNERWAYPLECYAVEALWKNERDRDQKKQMIKNVYKEDYGSSIVAYDSLTSDKAIFDYLSKRSVQYLQDSCPSILIEIFNKRYQMHYAQTNLAFSDKMADYFFYQAAGAMNDAHTNGFMAAFDQAYEYLLDAFYHAETKSKKQETAERFIGLSRQALDQKAFSAALSCYNEVICFLPPQAKHYIQRATLRLKYTENQAEAFQDLEAALMLSPSSEQKTEIDRLLPKQSTYYIAQAMRNIQGAKNLDRALACLEKALTLSPSAEQKAEIVSGFERLRTWYLVQSRQVQADKCDGLVLEHSPRFSGGIGSPTVCGHSQRRIRTPKSSPQKRSPSKRRKKGSPNKGLILKLRKKEVGGKLRVARNLNSLFCTMSDDDNSDQALNDLQGPVSPLGDVNLFALNCRN